MLAFAAAIAVTTSSAHAQNARTWVASNGDDLSATCGRTAPCKTFASAVSKTNAGGEVNCVDSAAYGAVTISKALTIDCTNVNALIAAPTTTALTVSAGASDKVFLRGLILSGPATSGYGIRYTGGAELHIEKVKLTGFIFDSISLSGTTGTGYVFVRDSVIARGNIAISVAHGSGWGFMSADRIRIDGMSSTGVLGLAGALRISVTNSVIENVAGSAVHVATGATWAHVDGNVIANNSTGVSIQTSTSTLTISNNSFFGNTTPISFSGGGLIMTQTNNRIIAATTVNTPNGGAIILK